MSQTILFIDGENFLYKIEDVLKLKSPRISSAKTTNVNLDKLFTKPLEGFKLDRKIFYAAKLKVHSETQKKSQELIDKQRRLKSSLTKQGFEFVDRKSVV